MEQQPLLDERRLRAAMANWDTECGKRLRDRRNTLDMKQGTLAAAVGVGTTAISNYELGLATPRDGIRIAIAVALACEVSDIWPPLERAEAWAIARAVA